MDNLLSLNIKKLFTLEKEKNLKKEELKDIDKKISDLKKQITELMDDNEITELIIDDVKVKRAVLTNYSIDSHNWSDQRFIKWLKENDYGDVIRETVHPATRNKILSEYCDAGNDLPEFIKDNYFDTIKYSTSKVK